MSRHDKFPVPSLIATQGDDVECYWADRIFERIPNYATIWEVFVGNDGEENALPMPGASPDAETARQILWERLYTLFESLALCWSLEEQLILKPEVRDYEAYAANLNRWMAFYSNLGRIHDMAADVALQLGDGGLVASLADFYQQRNIVLHGPKVPMKWTGNILTAPELGETKGKWNDKRMRWEDLAEVECKVIADHVTNTVEELEPKLDEFLSLVLALLEPQLGLCRVVWPAPPAPAVDFRSVSPGMEAPPVKPLAEGPRFGGNTSGTNAPVVDPTTIDPT